MPDQASRFSPQWENSIILEPLRTHTRTVIMLHGRGSTGKEFSTDLFETRCSTGETLRDLLPGYRWVFPSAPPRHSVIFGEDLTQWYGITSFVDTDLQHELQLEGIKASLVYLRGLISKEAMASPIGTIVLGGISQGFSIALLLILLGQPEIEALVGFSSWLPLRKFVEQSLNDAQHASLSSFDAREAVCQTLRSTIGLSRSSDHDHKSMPIFVGHCTDDDTVEVTHGKTMEDLLLRLGYDVKWRESPSGGHWISEPHGMNGLKSFLWLHGLVNSS